MSRPRLEALLFLALCACELALTIALIAQNRVPAGHDGYQYFTMQYYFLNGAVMTGEAPQWMPFMTHGTVGTWWFALEANPAQLVLLLFAPLLRGVNFLPLYYGGAFLDQLLLLVGVWLLGQRFFRSVFTTFFVSASVLGSCIWLPQPWHNLHFFYAVPLILHLCHRYLETGRRLQLFGALHLLALQTLGNLPYAIPVTTFFIASYLACYVAVAPGALSALRARLRLPDLGVLVLGGLSFVPAFLILKVGVGSLRSYLPGRTPAGVTTLPSFLVYAGRTGMDRWFEALAGVSPSIDYTLYMGVLAVPLLVVALLYERERRRAHLVLSMVPVFLLLGSQSFAKLLYHGWPFMKYYRHLILVSCFARLMLCFTAGLGLEALLRSDRRPRLVAAATCAFLALFLGACLLRGGEVTAFFQMLVQDDLGHYCAMLTHEFVEAALLRGLIVTSLAAVLLVLWVEARRPLRPAHCLGILLCLHLCELCAYKRAHLLLPTVAYSDAQREEILGFQQMPYRPRRGPAVRAAASRMIVNTDKDDWKAGHYWAENSFYFLDELEHRWRAESWLDPLDELMRAFWRQPVHDKRLPPHGYKAYRHLDFPEEHPAAPRIAGSTADKIQFFADAYRGDDAQAVADRLVAPDSTGDMLFVPGAGLAPAPAGPRADRLTLPYQVERFDANRIVFRVKTPRPVWVVYADVWHPDWHGRVNGAATPVYKGNLAYKAVRLGPGDNRVELWFDSPGVRWMRRYFSLCALAWLILIGRFIALILRAPTDQLRRRVDQEGQEGPPVSPCRAAQ